MYAKGLTTRQISEQIKDIYDFEVSEGFVSDVTDKLLPEIEDWQYRPLAELYPIIFIDAVHFSVKDNHIIRKLAAYVILGVTIDGQRSMFPTDTALLKALYLATFEAAKKWSMPLRNRGKVYGELAIMYEDRVPQ